jgi:hypothetical protein
MYAFSFETFADVRKFCGRPKEECRSGNCGESLDARKSFEGTAMSTVGDRFFTLEGNR